MMYASPIIKYIQNIYILVSFTGKIVTEGIEVTEVTEVTEVKGRDARKIGKL